MNRLSIAAGTTLALAALLGASEADAFQLEDAGLNKVRWQRDFVHFELVTSSFDPGDLEGFREAIAAWNSSGADFRIIEVTQDNAQGWLNGQNEVVRTSAGFEGEGDDSGRCVYWFDPFTGHLVEADILINDSADTPVAFTGGTDDHITYGGASVSLTEVAIHEFGHAIGLQHETDVYNNMGLPPFTHANGEDLYPYVGADSAFGAVALYGYRLGQDLSVVHLERTGTDLVYSKHGRTAVRSATGARYLAGGIPKGVDTFDVSFTYENIGPAIVHVSIALVLSPDSFIDDTDPVIATEQTFLGPYQVATRTHRITLPPGTPPGQHWVGAIVSNPAETGPRVNNATGVMIFVTRNGDWHHCHPEAPCQPGEGHCDGNQDCVAGSHCVANVGPRYGLPQGVHVCESGGVGSWAYCSTESPCEIGEGDCDFDSDCVDGAVCADDVGADYGWGATVDVCEQPPGHMDYCSPDAPCAHGEGDCDSSSECAAGTTCVWDVGAAYGWHPTVDVCELPVGHGSYCSASVPCQAGEGDCDSDAECTGARRCRDDLGPAFGFAPWVDVCL